MTKREFEAAIKALHETVLSKYKEKDVLNFESEIFTVSGSDFHIVMLPVKMTLEHGKQYDKIVLGE